jgi:hypothetical protein
MRQIILQGLEQVYSNLVNMVAEFLPRFLVMMIIILTGLLVAFLLKYIVRALLRLTKLDRVSEESGATGVLRMAHLPSMTELLSRSIFWVTCFGFILVGLSVLGIASLQEQISRLIRFLPEVFVAILIMFLGVAIANFLSRTALLAAVNAGYISAKIGDHDDPGGTRFGKANRDLGFFNRFWSYDVGPGYRVRIRRSRSGSEEPRETLWGHQKGER